MNRNHVIAITGLAFILGAGNALAQDEEDEVLDATMFVIGNADVGTPDVFVTGIPLPADAVDNADDSANVNVDLINTALGHRQMALEDAAAITADVAEAAQDKAENSSRAEDVRPDAPGERPVPPGG